jgi:hypothetical protein
MADIADQSDAQNEAYLKAVLSRRLPPAPAANGACLNCLEPVAKGLRWCDKDCLADYERRQERA